MEQAHAQYQRSMRLPIRALITIILPGQGTDIELFLFYFWQFKDAEQYQRSMRMPIGADWNTAITHNKVSQ